MMLTTQPWDMRFSIEPNTAEDCIALMKLDVDVQIQFRKDAEHRFDYVIEAYIGDYGNFVFKVEYEDFIEEHTNELLTYCRRFMAEHIE